ncbi:TetR/AcrR family transcriptional regulator [Thermanaerothrix sp.]|jgi:AcrR family transcriptional regulator|uniref:TetR/AcrR family transcriptional regulator n=1 Tax=Thermanaerothrix sp. TaxID=2972675 RepID=UPI002ADE352A|nr:TetR/AcrR family transcriptional regulator [Thermanaerothrix sp.]
MPKPQAVNHPPSDLPPMPPPEAGERRPDRRVQRTRQQLRDALITLILERGYDAVRVEDITARANLGRATFYLHYRDKEALLLDSIQQTVDDLMAQVSAFAPPHLDAGSEAAAAWLQRAIALVFDHAAENATLYRVILRGEGTAAIFQRIHAMICQAVITYLDAHRPPRVPPLPAEVLANYFAGALLGLLTWWLEHGTPYPPQAMAQMFYHLFYDGVGHLTLPPTPTDG